MPKLLVATRNRGKVREYEQLLAGIPFELTSLDQIGIETDVEETGKSFEENAVLKATFYAGSSGLLTLADDSGLEVDCLGGEPGVFSARYAGPGATDAERIRFLLDKLSRIPWEQRTARFRCAIAIANVTGLIKVVDGRLEGIIAFESEGAYGFGYDPIFYVPELGKMVAELPPDEKNLISHRARAAAKAREILIDLYVKGVQT